MHRPDVSERVPAQAAVRRRLGRVCARQLDLPIASTAPLATITDRFGRAVHRFAQTEGIPWVDFVKGQRKDDVMHEHLRVVHPGGGRGVHRPSAGERDRNGITSVRTFDEVALD